MENNYKYLEKAFDKKEKAVVDVISYNKSNINLSEIESILVANAGRYCEHYASDIICDVKELHDCIKDDDKTNEILAIGLRENGTDENTYLTCRLNQCNTETDICNLICNYYRKIFLIKIIKAKDIVRCIMKEVDEEIIQAYKEENSEWNG